MRKYLANVILSLIALSLALAVLVNLITSPYSASLAGAPSVGCDGDIMVHKDAGDPDPFTAVALVEPRVCLFHLHADRFDPGSTVEWAIRKHTGETQVLAGALTILAGGTGQTGQLSLPNGQYTVAWHQAGCPGSDKLQEFKVECQLNDPTETSTPAPKPTQTSTPLPGCGGEVNIHKDAGEPDPITAVVLAEPRVCLFHLHGYRFDAGSTVEWVIKTLPGDTPVLSGNLTIQADGTGYTGQLSLPNGRYTVYWHQAGCPDDQLVVFKVECQPTDPTETVTATPQPNETATPMPAEIPTATPTSAPQDRLAQVSILCHGCWSSIAQVWVGGTEQRSLVFAPDAGGTPAVLWTFWNNEPWQIRVRVMLPAELDANRWKLILWVGTGPQDYIWADETTFNLEPRQWVKINFQLVDTSFWQ